MIRRRRDPRECFILRRGRGATPRSRQTRQFPRPLTDPPPQNGKLLEHRRDPHVITVHRPTSHASSCPADRHRQMTIRAYMRVSNRALRAQKRRSFLAASASLHGVRAAFIAHARRRNLRPTRSTAAPVTASTSDPGSGTAATNRPVWPQPPMFVLGSRT